MRAKRRPAARKTTNKSTTTKGTSSYRFLVSKSGKLSKTNLHALFTSPRLWNSLTPPQQARVLTSLGLSQLISSSTSSKGEKGHANPFTTPAGEVHFDISLHLERFREHLVEGRFEPGWQRGSEEVRRRREGGEFEGLWSVEVGGEGSIGEDGRVRVEEVGRRRVERIAGGEE